LQLQIYVKARVIILNVQPVLTGVKQVETAPDIAEADAAGLAEAADGAADEALVKASV
jgi:hypothetical protein